MEGEEQAGKEIDRIRLMKERTKEGKEKEREREGWRRWSQGKKICSSFSLPSWYHLRQYIACCRRLINRHTWTHFCCSAGPLVFKAFLLMRDSQEKLHSQTCHRLSSWAGNRSYS